MTPVRDVPTLQKLMARDARTPLGVALRNLKGEVIGVCEAINKNEGTFDDEGIEILETLAAHAADAFETAQFRKLIEAEDSVPLGKDGQYPKCRFSTQNIIGMSHR